MSRVSERHDMCRLKFLIINIKKYEMEKLVESQRVSWETFSSKIEQLGQVFYDWLKFPKKKLV